MATATRESPDRRRIPRFDVWGEVHAYLGASALPVLDLSEGGFAVQSPTAFVRGSLSGFELCSSRCDVIVMARNVHCLHVVSDAEPWYVAGFAFGDNLPAK